MPPATSPRPSPQKVAVLHDKQTYGSGVATQVKDTLTKEGVNVALFEGINVGDSDYSAIITKLKSAGVDLVYFGGYHPELGLLLRQSREQGLKVQFMGPEGTANQDLVAIAGPAIEGLLVTLPADFTKLPGNESIVKAFRTPSAIRTAPSRCRLCRGPDPGRQHHRGGRRSRQGGRLHAQDHLQHRHRQGRVRRQG